MLKSRIPSDLNKYFTCLKCDQMKCITFYLKNLIFNNNRCYLLFIFYFYFIKNILDKILLMISYIFFLKYPFLSLIKKKYSKEIFLIIKN